MATRNHDERSDDDLVAAARDGDRNALEQLLRRHHDRIALLCRRLCRDPGDAQDATQNALIAIVAGLPGFDGRSRFSTWSHRVATNAALDELRRRSRRPTPSEPSTAQEPVDPSQGPDELATGRARRARLARALDELPESLRLAVLLRDVAELDYAEIAEVLGVPGGTVRSRIARGRSRLAATLATDPLVGNPRQHVDVGGDELT